MAPIAQKWIFACVECGCIFTKKAKNQRNNCPVCKSQSAEKIEGIQV